MHLVLTREMKNLFILRRHDTRHNDTQHKRLNCDTQHKRHSSQWHSTKALSIIMLSVTMLHVSFSYNVECRYTDCHCAECRSAHFKPSWEVYQLLTRLLLQESDHTQLQHHWAVWCPFEISYQEHHFIVQVACVNTTLSNSSYLAFALL
jgi:hypothetical protein